MTSLTSAARFLLALPYYLCQLSVFHLWILIYQSQMGYKVHLQCPQLAFQPGTSWLTNLGCTWLTNLGCTWLTNLGTSWLSNLGTSWLSSLGISWLYSWSNSWLYSWSNSWLYSWSNSWSFLLFLRLNTFRSVGQLFSPPSYLIK